jgi:hypothetical protein
MALLSMLAVRSAAAHEGDPHVEHEIALSYTGPQVAVGAPEAREAVEAIVALGAKVHNQAGQALFPAGTSVDDVEWMDNVVRVYLTISPTRPGDWRLSHVDLETITSALQKPFGHDPAFAGTFVSVRDGALLPVYRSLEWCVPECRQAASYDYSKWPWSINAIIDDFRGPLSPRLPEAPPFQIDPEDQPERPFLQVLPDGEIEVLDAKCAREFFDCSGIELLEEDTGTEEQRQGAIAPHSGDGDSRGGPVGNASRQPTGALSGVTIYIGGGHGWTAGASAWFLQRPVLLNMCEDYGNIDMVNLTAAYAFNAGATVVPLRPVGWQPIEIVLDNDDPGVTYTGTWSDSTGTQYFENGATNTGIPYRFATAGASETATARFAANVATTGFYPVYCFAIAGANRVRQTYRVSHGGGLTAVTVDHRNVGNGWVWLGSYYLDAGGANYVEVTNVSPDAGVVVADAIRWGGGYGDVSRPGPNSVSGYPRDEEGQRYWAHSLYGNNTVGFPSTIWDLSGSDDQSDNVGTGGRIAREMNQVPAGGAGVERWKRIHLEFHSNAFGSGARGQLCLVTDLGATTNQAAYATTLSNEIDADMNLLSSQGEFEFAWVDRAAATLTGSYGAIATSANSNEFDATIAEMAFHDNDEDAALLRDPRVRSYMARACVQGIVRFLNSLSAGQVPLAFLPDAPREFAVRDMGGGDVTISWQPPQADAARGDAATGYVVYRSSNGIAFGNPIVLGNVTSTTVTAVPTGETRYFRVAATNAGGESMPSETLAVRRPASGTATVLIVNGFDRLRRQQNPIQTFTQPPNYAGLSIERQLWRESNAFDYVIEHGAAIAAAGLGFSSCSNEAVGSGAVLLAGFAIVDWMLGVESTEDLTFSAAEQTRITTYLNGGGKLFISGSDIAYDLINQNHGAAFAQNTLHIGFSNNDANTYTASPTGNGALAGLGTIQFSLASGAPYDVFAPDILLAGSGAGACLTYSTGGVAGVQYASGTYNVITLGFPFEAIGSTALQAQVMQRVIQWLMTAGGPLFGDFDNDGDVDFADFQVMSFCWQGPGNTYAPGQVCLEFDGDGDRDVDMLDFARFQQEFTGPPP